LISQLLKALKSLTPSEEEKRWGEKSKNRKIREWWKKKTDIAFDFYIVYFKLVPGEKKKRLNKTLTLFS